MPLIIAIVSALIILRWYLRLRAWFIGPIPVLKTEEGQIYQPDPKRLVWVQRVEIFFLVGGILFLNIYSLVHYFG